MSTYRVVYGDGEEVVHETLRGVEIHREDGRTTFFRGRDAVLRVRDEHLRSAELLHDPIDDPAASVESAMPAAFIGHGSPMNAVESNRYTRAWRAFGTALPRPRAVVCISAHWYINATAVTAMTRPRTIHDFYGFPKQLFDVEYPAPGLPALAGEIAELAEPAWVGADTDSWGLDHGTWSVLAHVLPDASVPVVQLSINAEKDFDYHFELGRCLAPLRERGVLVIGSGNVVHNLGAASWEHADDGYDWARRFDDRVREQVLADPTGVLSLATGSAFRQAAPTPDHFIPLLHFAGMAAAGNETVLRMVAGYTGGSISMASYTIGVSIPDETGAGTAAEPAMSVPPDESNI